MGQKCGRKIIKIICERVFRAHRITTAYFITGMVIVVVERKGLLFNNNIMLSSLVTRRIHFDNYQPTDDPTPQNFM